MIFFAGQISGVEGYVESAASGLQAGINAARYVIGKTFNFPQGDSYWGFKSLHNLCRFRQFSTMNITFGLLPL